MADSLYDPDSPLPVLMKNVCLIRGERVFQSSTTTRVSSHLICHYSLINPEKFNRCGSREDDPRTSADHLPVKKWHPRDVAGQEDINRVPGRRRGLSDHKVANLPKPLADTGGDTNPLDQSLSIGDEHSVSELTIRIFQATG